MLSPNPHNDWCLVPAPSWCSPPTTVVKSRINRPTWETDSAKSITDHKHDNERGCSPLEELERLLAERGLIMLVHDKPGELREQPDRPILIQALFQKEREGATTIPKGSRTKRSEAPGACACTSHDIVSSAWEHAAAL